MQNAQGKIADFNAGRLTLLAGCDEEQSLEHAVMGVLNRVRNTASEVRALLCCTSPACSSPALALRAAQGGGPRGH
jgi:hypothetical protein